MLIAVIISLFIFIGIYNLFVYVLTIKIKKLEKKTISLFQERNSKIIWVFQTTKDELIKANEIFEEFFDLRRRDLFENIEHIDLETKLLLYRKIHNEINFIFKTCEKHKTIQDNAIYNYLKEEVSDLSEEIWQKIEIYNLIKEKYNKYKNLSRIMIIWYLY